MLTTHPLPGNAWRERIVGLERCVPLRDGRLAPYVSLDNAASTPALREVLEARIVRRDYRGVYSRAAGSSDYSPAGYHETILDYLPVLSGEPFTRSH